MNKSGQILPIVLAGLVTSIIAVFSIVSWVQRESVWSVKHQKTTSAVNLAQAGIDRATWKLQSTTSTWVSAMAGVPIPGYAFDVTYNDIEGGTYRISITSGPLVLQVTVISEGRDNGNRETRAVSAILEDETIPGPLFTGGILNYAGAFEAHWGPLVAQNNIVLSGAAASLYFPRKFSRQTVVGPVGNPRDTNGLTPPNTDNVEWWSNYPVPAIPVLDFATLRSSAQANGTLNFYTGTASSETLNASGNVWPGSPFASNTATGHGVCVHPDGTAYSSHANHFTDSNHHPKSKQNLIWYWDGDLMLTGNFYSGGYVSGDPQDPCHRLGLRGTIIVRGNLTVDSGDCYQYTANIPPEAWKEYQKIDTGASNEYPGDTGLHSNAGTFICGNQTWTGGPAAQNTDVGLRGFIYVGGNLLINLGATSDFGGAIWVIGNVTNNNTTEASLVFYDRTLQVPTLNVVLARKSWIEVPASPIPWP